MPVYLAAILGYLLLLPPQFNASIAGSAIPPYRFFLLVASLYVLGKAAGGRVRPTWVDLLIGLSIAWISLAMSITSDWQEALTASIAHAADIGLGYFFARMVFRDLRDFRMFLILMLPGVLIIGLLVMLESVTFSHIIQENASRLTGKPFVYRSDPRMGLMRAQGPFAHPISAGVFLGSFLPLYWLAGFKGHVKFGGVLAAFCSFFTVSSAALLSLAASGALLFYNWLTRHFVNVTWRLFFFFTGLFVFTAELGTNAGTFSLLMRFASLNSVSGYHRVNIWKFGSQSVEKHPWFGIGYGYWERPVWMTDSVDNYWLLQAMRFGFPASVMIGLATLIGVIMIMRKSERSTGRDQQAERGIAIAMSVFALGLVSVAVWLSVQVWYFMLLGMAVSLAAGPATQRIPQGARSARPRPVVPIRA